MTEYGRKHTDGSRSGGQPPKPADVRHPTQIKCNCPDCGKTLQQSRSAVTDDMVERAARAIVKRNWPSVDPMGINEMWDGYALDARAALDAALSQESAQKPMSVRLHPDNPFGNGEYE